jgi:type II secretory ATPase GspE/PulE/Tfp pilus assembly ATPase PilB-like protein
MKRLNAPAGKYFTGKGCKNCDGTGFRGRTVITEVMLTSPAIQNAIMQRADASVIRKISHDEGMTTMKEDGIQKAVNGLTTLEEVARAV